MIKVIAKQDLYINIGCKNQKKSHVKGNEYILWSLDSAYNQNQISSDGCGLSTFNNEDFRKYFYFK